MVDAGSDAAAVSRDFQWTADQSLGSALLLTVYATYIGLLLTAAPAAG